MIYIELEQIILLQNEAIRKTGGETGIRDYGSLESAYYAPLASFAEVEAFPSILEKAARLAWGLTVNHPFIDGNKRIGSLALLVMLRANHIDFSIPKSSLADEFYLIAQGKHSYSDLYDWIQEHLI